MSERDLVGIMAIIKDAGADKLKSSENLANRTKGSSKKTTDSAGALTDDGPMKVLHISWPVLRYCIQNLWKKRILRDKN